MTHHPEAVGTGRRRRGDRWGVGLVLALGVMLASAGPARPGIFGDKVVVQEVALVVDLADALSPRALRDLAPEDLQVLEGGELRKVTRIQDIRISSTPTRAPVIERVEDCPWVFMVYIDMVLSSPETLFDSALTLGGRADALVGLGCVDVVVADPVPRVVVSRSRSPEYVAKVLAELARGVTAERGRAVTAGGSRTEAGSASERVRVQWDRLISFVADRRVSAPRALFLVSDGFLLPVEDLEILAGRGAPGGGVRGPRRLADVVIDAAQTLSAYGWLTVPMPRVPRAGKPPEPGLESFDRWQETAGGNVRAGEERRTINFLGTTRAGRPTGSPDDRLYEAYLLPSLAPLRALAEATSGDVVWSAARLDAFLDGLARRRVIWIRVTEPHDGKIRRLQVRLADEGIHLDAPWWKRSSTPERVAEARLRRLVNGEAMTGGLSVEAELLAAEERPAPVAQRLLRVRVAPKEFTSGASIGHIRLSLGFADGSGIFSFLHRLDYDAPPLGGAWEYDLPFELPAGVKRIAVAVEDLSLEVWGATIVGMR